MNFNRHSNLEGQHAFLGASKYHWINYDEAKVVDVYSNFLAAQKGTVLHEFGAVHPLRAAAPEVTEDFEHVRQ